MENLKPFKLPPPISSQKSESSTSSRLEYAAERANLLFGCYRKGDANDPKTYVTAVAAVLAEYPEDTIRFVTDPRTGLPSKVDWMPTVGEVKRACEDHYGPTRRAMEREAAERRMLAERKRLAITDGRPRKTYDELVADCRARGLMIGGGKRSAVETIDKFLTEHGVTREQFDALPDLPADIGAKR